MKLINQNDNIPPVANTTTISQLTPEMKNSYDEKITPIAVVKFESGENYGPFYRIDAECWVPSRRNQLGRWAGLTKPATKIDARTWYDLDEAFNSLEYVHSFLLKIPVGKTDCIGFFGKVKKGTGFQINLNNNCVEFVEKVGNPIKLL